MSDPINKLHRAARRASGFLDLEMKKQAIEELESLLFDDDYIDSLYEADMEEERLAVLSSIDNRKKGGKSDA